MHLWEALDRFHPPCGGEAKQFPQSQAQVKQMLADGELLMALTFNPNEPANLVANGELRRRRFAWQHQRGTIGNTHFVAFPINAQAREGAQVVANFLLSPEAQARKADSQCVGRPTVLAMNKLSPEQAALFGPEQGDGGVVLGGPTIPERIQAGCDDRGRLARTLRRMISPLLRLLAAGLLGTFWGVPLLLGLFFALPPAFDCRGLAGRVRLQAVLPSITLSIATGTAALLISLALALLIVAGVYDTPQWKRTH